MAEEGVTVVPLWVYFAGRINRIPSKSGERGTELLGRDWALDVSLAVVRGLDSTLSAVRGH